MPSGNEIAGQTQVNQGPRLFGWKAGKPGWKTQRSVARRSVRRRRVAEPKLLGVAPVAVSANSERGLS